ncbi:MAG: hypothetical protein Fur0010_06760 [Bdellovibrio sp.]
MNKKLNNVFNDWKKIKNEIADMAKYRNVNLKEVQGLIQKVVKQAESDIKGLVDQDVKIVMNKLKTERKALEKMVDDILEAEMRKAKTFISSYKKQFSSLQKTVEATLKKKVGKSTKKKTTKKKTRSTKKKSTVDTTATPVQS